MYMYILRNYIIVYIYIYIYIVCGVCVCLCVHCITHKLVYSYQFFKKRLFSSKPEIPRFYNFLWNICVPYIYVCLHVYIMHIYIYIYIYYIYVRVCVCVCFRVCVCVCICVRVYECVWLWVFIWVRGITPHKKEYSYICFNKKGWFSFNSEIPRFYIFSGTLYCNNCNY